MSENRSSAPPVERMLAILGAAACLIISIAVWRGVSVFQSMWPLPALYLIELPAVAMVTAISIIRAHPSAGLITWVALGIFAAFALVGAWSVGLLYLPVVLVFAILGVAVDARAKSPVVPHLGVFLIAAVVQAAIMFAAIRLLDPGGMF